MRHIILLSFVLIVILSCSRPIMISPLHPYTVSSDTIVDRKRSICNWKYFVVENCDVKDSTDLAVLRTFASKQLDSNYRSYNQFQIIFYKKTKVINENYRSTPKRDLGYYGDDRIAEFNWFRGYPSEMLLEDGRVLNSDVIIMNVPN